MFFVWVVSRSTGLPVPKNRNIPDAETTILNIHEYVPKIHAFGKFLVSKN
jgi:hypothetical protein